MNNDRNEPFTVMFMSADIVGATAFKDSTPGRDETPAWPAAFETFFRELPLVLMGQVAMAFSDADRLPALGVWKVMGDEMVFRAFPRTAEEALMLTKSFYCSLVAYDSRVSVRWPLRLRGCCWAARFPEVAIEALDVAVVDRVFLMGAGRIIEDNEPEEFFNYAQNERIQLFLSQIPQHWRGSRST